MRKSSTLIGLTLMALATGARAQDQVPAAPAPPTPAVGVDVVPPATIPMPTQEATPPEPPRRPIKVGVSFLTMALGKLTTPIGGLATTGDASFAYGVGFLASIRLIAGLEVGFAPQIIYNVQYKQYPAEITPPKAGKETDLMARVAYTFPVVETIELYVEVLPGYSTINQPGTGSSSGFVLGFGGGIEMSVTDRIFADLAGGYQLGYQSVNVGGSSLEDRTKFVRVNLGGGVRF